MKLTTEVAAVLLSLDVAARESGYHAVITGGQLDRKVYTAVNAALEACGGKWSRKARAHVFDDDPTTLIEAAVAQGEITTLRELNASMGFFETPVPLADQLVAMADVTPGMLVLEPSAGRGRIVDALVRAGADVVAVERDPARRGFLATRRPQDRARVLVRSEDDFMSMPAPPEPFDAVVMNPPFVRSGAGDHIDHVRRAFAMLRPGGVLVSVLPGGVVFRQDRRHELFQREVAALPLPGEFTPLPERSFAESGTNVNTVVLRMFKPSTISLDVLPPKKGTNDAQ